MVGYIYLITDTTNNMKYTGKHHYNKEGELDPSYHGSGVIIKNIYKKRPETLKEEYIKTCYSEEEMCSDEQYYIKFYNTLWPNGYNLTEGGDGGVKCEETRKKISNSLKGKPKSEEQKKKMSETLIGEKNPFYRKHHSYETKKKISESLKGKPAHNKGVPMSEEQKKKMRNDKRSKKVLQFTLNGQLIREWSSLHECERNGFDHAAVGRCCNGKRKSAYGFKWCYAEE